MKLWVCKAVWQIFQLEQVAFSPYPGWVINQDIGCSKGIQARLGKGHGVSTGLKKLRKSHGISIGTVTAQGTGMSSCHIRMRKVDIKEEWWSTFEMRKFSKFSVSWYRKKNKWMGFAKSRNRMKTTWRHKKSGILEIHCEETEPMPGYRMVPGKRKTLNDLDGQHDRLDVIISRGTDTTCSDISAHDWFVMLPTLGWRMAEGKIRDWFSLFLFFSFSFVPVLQYWWFS